MSLIVTATLQNPDGTPLVVDAQVCLFTSKGDPKILASGRSDKLGKLALDTRFVVGDYQPRLQLRLLRGDTYVEAAEDLVGFTADACDFGTVKFATAIVPIKLQPESESPDAVPQRGVEGEGDDRTALIEQLKSEHALDLAKALATQSQQLNADRAAALAAQSQQLAADKQSALATQAQQLAADKAAALAAQSQQLAADRSAALAAQAQQLAADKQSALAAQAQQLAADKAAALAQRSQELAADKQSALAAQAQQLAADRAAALAAQAQQQAEALAERDAKIAALGEQLADAPREATIEDLAQTTAAQIQRVQQSLRDDKAGLQLGKVSLQLKVLPGSNASRVALPQTRDIEKVGAAALGSLDLAFLPDPGAIRPKPTNLAPRLLGYTEALARRKLGERGLGVEVVHQFVTTAAEHGRVVLQRPAPKAAVAEGATVLIAIGRKDEDDPRPT